MEIIEQVRYLIDCYKASQYEHPAAIYMTLEEKTEIWATLRDVNHQWGTGDNSDSDNLFGCRIEIHNKSRMVALTRDERGLTKVIVCPFCNGPMTSHCHPSLLGTSNAPVTQYDCVQCYVIWPTTQWIDEQIKNAMGFLKESIKQTIKEGE